MSNFLDARIRTSSSFISASSYSPSSPVVGVRASEQHEGDNRPTGLSFDINDIGAAKLIKYKEDADDDTFDDFIIDDLQQLVQPQTHNQTRLQVQDHRHTVNVSAEGNRERESLDSGSTSYQSVLEDFSADDLDDSLEISIDSAGGQRRRISSSSMSSRVSLAEELAQRLKNTTKATDLDSLDDFLNYRFDEKDFEGDENKDVHMRRSKDILKLMARIRGDCPRDEVTQLCDQLIEAFDAHPDQKEYVVTHHGVTPILDMIESQYPSNRGAPGSGFGIRTDYVGAITSDELGPRNHNVLRVLNKIVDGNARVQEQLCLMGLIPLMIRLFQWGCVASYTALPPSTSYNEKKNFSPFSPVSSLSYTSSSSSSSTASPSTAPSFMLFFHRLNGKSTVNAMQGCNEVDPTAVEAARFIHIISMASPLTVQMLIGSGGLPVLVQMMSFSSLLTAKAAADARESHTPVLNSLSAAVGGRESFAGNSSSEALQKEKEKRTESCVFEDAQKIVYMGIECILQVFAVHSSRTRDFCRLLVKLGFLPHIATAFTNILALQKPLHDSASLFNSSQFWSPRSDIGLTLGKGIGLGVGGGASGYYSPVDTRENSPVQEVGGAAATDASATASAISSAATAADSLGYKYAHQLATILVLFSRSDSMVAEQMAKADGCVLSAILNVLQSPVLRSQAISNITLSISPSKFHAVTNSSDKKRPAGGVDLPPDYVEIIHLLLKCTKNLSMEPSVLADLERSGAVVTLVPLLNGPLSDKCKNNMLLCIFNLCRINKRRQEQAAMHGIIPHLQKLINEGSHFRQFALPIICDLAHSSAATRIELWKHDGVPFYVNLLKENYWQTFALNSLAVW